MDNYNILKAIGNTPLVEITRLNPNPAVKIFAKVEYFNPGGSIKDRPALFMIEAGEKSGELTARKTVIEATSGNTGIGLALVCAVKGYPLLLTMSEAVSIERRKILKARGADIMLTPGHLGTDGAIEEAYRLAREYPDTYFMTDQFNNEANWKAHYHGTANEIWQQTQGQITTLVATMGTTGTLMGLSRRLKELNSQIQIIGVEPYLGHKLQGLKNMKEAYQPEIFDKNKLDQKINIEDEQAFEMTRQLAREEGLFVGMSSGAAMAIAQKVAESLDKGVIVVIFPDGGERYLSTPVFAIKEKVDLLLYNKLKRAKEPFSPILPGRVSVYSCGPTVHKRISLNECRRFVHADLLCRYLEYRGYAVNHVMNITDLDDNIIIGSEKAGTNPSDFTAVHIQSFKDDLNCLGIKPASEYPKSSEHIDDMVELSERLAKKGLAYEKLRSLYFDISKASEYGRLSGIDINKIRLGATVDLDEYEKANPRDFTILKRTRLSELKRGIYTKTQWGNVRPSYHIQSVAIAMKYLGETFDIHASSQEMAFPHHENELAIAKGLTGKDLANYWVHCEGVTIDPGLDSEMPSDLTLDQMIDMGFSARQIRFWLLSSHYRKPLTFTRDRLENTARSLKRLDTCIQNLSKVKGGVAYPEVDQLCYDIKQTFITAMDDDLNISRVLASTYKIIKQINILITEKRIDANDAQKLLDAFAGIDAVLGIMEFEQTSADPTIQKLIADREKARKDKNFEQADRIRDQLIAQGIIIQDKKVES